MKYEAYERLMKESRPDLYGNLSFDCTRMAWVSKNGAVYTDEKDIPREKWKCSKDQQLDETPIVQKTPIVRKKRIRRIRKKKVETQPAPEPVVVPKSEPTPVTKVKKVRKKSRKTNIEQREKALNRDNYRCTVCGETEFLEVHHIIHRANGGTDDLDNLITLCRKCHAEKHKGEPIYNLMVSRFRH